MTQQCSEMQTKVLVFPSPDWTVSIQPTESQPGGASYRAEIHRAGAFMCSIVLAGCLRDLEAATRALEVRLRRWLLDFEARPRTRDSGFHLL